MDAAGVSVAQFLKPYAEKRETGALEVYRGPYRGILYIQGGNLVQAEYLGKVGLSAAYDILDLESTTMQWRDKLTPDSTSIALDLAQLLEELEAAKNLPPLPPMEDEEAQAPPREQTLVFSEGQNTSSDLLKGLYFSLEWLNSPEKTEAFEFENRDQASYTVGSSEDCNFYLPHPGVQPLHFCLLVHADHVEIWDLGTDNATFLNEELISQAVISSGDVIQAGDARLRFSLHMRRSGKLGSPETPKETVVPKASSPRIRGPITADSILKQQSEDPALRKMIGRFFNRKGK